LKANVKLGEGCILGDTVVVGPNITLPPHTKVSTVSVPQTVSVGEEWYMSNFSPPHCCKKPFKPPTSAMKMMTMEMIQLLLILQLLAVPPLLLPLQQPPKMIDLVKKASVLYGLLPMQKMKTFVIRDGKSLTTML